MAQMIDAVGHDESGRPNTPIAGKKRFLIFAVLFSLASIFIVARYAYLMLFPQQPSRPAGLERPARRGPILDRNGRILALETRLGNITLWRPEMHDPVELSRNLAPLLDMGSEELLDRINASQSDFMYLKRQENESVVRLVEAGIQEGRFRGVGIEPVLGRIYPERNLAAQIIGFVGNENNGLEGIEFAFNRELASGPAIPMGPGSRRGGSQVFLSLDVSVQHILETIAAQVMEDNKAEAVMFMAMDPRTGEILGSASLPGFDPNNFRNSDELSRMDRPAIWSYEPGSVFKIFSLAALLDSGLIREDTVFYCNGHYERVSARGERTVINCLGAHGRVRAREIIIYSCNAGAAYAADMLDTQVFYEYLRVLGFGGRTGAGNPGETAGFLRPTERWSERSKPTISMGQEIAVSALQMLQAASAVANDGVLVPPKLVSRVVSPDGRVISNFEGEMPRRVFQPESARAMRDYMMDVTSSVGTGWRAFVDDLSLAIKTGTAQMIDPRTGAYSATDFITSTIALLPAESPSLVLYLVIVKPRGSSVLAGRIAAPPIRDAAEALVNYLGIPRGRNPQISHPGAISIPALAYPAINELVPNFTGLSKRQLLPLLLRSDLSFHISGDGWVRRQSPQPGTPISADTLIVLELE
jgi:cell division protein FtsI (penicillin-binding protein 3)